MMRNFIRSFETLTILLQQVRSDSSVRSCWTCQNRCCRGCCDSESNPNLVFLFLNLSLAVLFIYRLLFLSSHRQLNPKHALCSLPSFFFPLLLNQVRIMLFSHKYNRANKQHTFEHHYFYLIFIFLLLFCLLAIHFGEVRKKQHKTDSFFFLVIFRVILLFVELGARGSHRNILFYNCNSVWRNFALIFAIKFCFLGSK